MPYTQSPHAETRLSLGAVATVVLGLVFVIGLVAMSMAGTWLGLGWPDVSMAAKASVLPFVK